MITMLMGWGLSARAAKLVAYVAVPLLILLAFYLVLDAYGDSREQAGKDKADAAWIEAGRRLEQKAADAGAKADEKAGHREAEHQAELQKEKEKVDAAMAEGSSPLDVLFGTDGR
jgi:hypothetical protein